MDFKKPKKKEMINAVAMGSGAVVGVSLGQGVNTFIKGEKNTQTAVKAGLALASFFAISCISSADALSQSAKGALAGMGAEKTLGVVRDLMADSALATEDAEEGSGARFAQAALGLKGAEGCGCNQAVTRLPQLNYSMPATTIPMMEDAGTYKPMFK
jgi:hypothetical protein